ncbi:MAG: hypothetical protein JW941_06745, partial [Candidatus Coatesbacteria bacterium]|nr:hypothetical protein [Candidatus Coatesbacteria bacterium]
MRPMGTPQSQQYQKKAATRKIIWTIVLIFIIFSLYSVLKPLVVMYIFQMKVAKICDEKRLMVRDLDFAPIIAEIRTVADDWSKQGLSMSEGAIVCTSEGGINH